MQLSHQQKNVFLIFSAFFEYRLNLKIFEGKEHPDGFCTFEVSQMNV